MSDPAVVPTRPATRFGLLARLGQRSPLVVTGIYAIGYTVQLVGLGVAMKFGIPALKVPSAIVWLVCLGISFAIVTWFRDEDVMAAGFLLGVSFGAVGLFVPLLALAIRDGSIGGAALGFIGSLIPVGGITIVAILVSMVLISAGRAFHPGIATPTPPPRKH